MTTAGPFNVGDVRKVQTVFLDEDGVPQWPGTTIGKYRQPDGTIGDLTPSDVTLSGPFTLPDGTVVTDPKAVESTLPIFNAPGMWEWSHAGTDGVTDTDEGLIIVGYPGAANLT